MSGRPPATTGGPKDGKLQQSPRPSEDKKGNLNKDANYRPNSILNSDYRKNSDSPRSSAFSAILKRNYSIKSSGNSSGLSSDGRPSHISYRSYHMTLKDREEEERRVTQFRKTMASKLRTAYYNLYARTSLNINDGPGNIKQKINFTDLNTKQKQILEKCRKTFEVYHEDSESEESEGEDADDEAKDGDDEDNETNWDEDEEDENDDDEPANPLFDFSEFSFASIKKKFDGGLQNDDIIKNCCHPHVFDQEKEDEKNKEDKAKELISKEVSENKRMISISKRRRDRKNAMKELVKIFPQLSVEDRRKLGEEIVFFHPFSLAMIAWKFILVFTSYKMLNGIPEEFAFDDSKGWIRSRKEVVYNDYMNYDILHLLDIVVNYNTGYYDAVRRSVVMNKTLVNYKYNLSFKFYLDVVSAVSWNMLFTYVLNFMHNQGVLDLTDPNNTINDYNKKYWIMALHTIKLLRVFKLADYWIQLRDLYGREVENSAKNFVFITIFMISYVLIHFSAYLQWGIPKFYNYPADSWPVTNLWEMAGDGGAAHYPGVQLPEFFGGHNIINPKQTDVSKKVEYMIETQGPAEFGVYWHPTNGTHIAKSSAGGIYGHEANQMRSVASLEGKIRWMANLTDYRGLDYLIKYQFTFLKAIAQMLTLAYGGTPSSETDLAFHIPCIFFGALIWGLLLAIIINWLATLVSSEDNYTQAMGQIMTYVNFKNLPSISKQLILKYFEVKWAGKTYDEVKVLDSLSPTLRKRVLIAARLPWIMQAPIFKNISLQFLIEICHTMHDELYMTNQLVISDSRVCDKIIIPYEGDLLQYIPSLDILEVLQPGVILGETCLIYRKFWNGEVYSLGWTRAYTVDPKDVFEIGKLYPNDYKRLLKNFKIYTEIVDDIDYIEEIDNKIQQLNEKRGHRKTADCRRTTAARNIDGEEYFTMSKKLQSTVNKFIERHTIGLEDELAEEKYMDEMESYGSWSSDDLDHDDSEIQMTNKAGFGNFLQKGGKSGQRTSGSSSVHYSGNTNFNYDSRDSHMPGPSQGRLRDQFGKLLAPSKGKSFINSEDGDSKQSGPSLPLRSNPLAYKFSARSEVFKNPAWLAQSQMLPTMLVKRESVVLDRMLADDKNGKTRSETNLLKKNESGESQNIAHLDESGFGVRDSKTSLSRNVSVKQVLGFGSTRPSSSEQNIRNTSSNSKISPDYSQTDLNNEPKTKLNVGSLDAIKRKLSFHSRSNVLLANQFARENKNKEFGVIEIDESSVSGSVDDFKLTSKAKTSSLATEKIISNDMTSNLVSTHGIKTSDEKVLRRQIRLISKESSIRIRGRDGRGNISRTSSETSFDKS